jgi:hypothetical protein
MSEQSNDLSSIVIAMRPFVPAKNFAVSKRFYVDLGFRVEPLGDTLAEMHLGPYSFLLQDYYVEDWAGNFVMHMLVTNLDRWWKHVESLDLASHYGVESPREPKLESWGLRVLYVFDPCGVLWHIAELPAKDRT